MLGSATSAEFVRVLSGQLRRAVLGRQTQTSGLGR